MKTNTHNEKLNEIVDELESTISRVSALSDMLDHMEEEPLPKGTSLLLLDVKNQLSFVSEKLGTLARYFFIIN